MLTHKLKNELLYLAPTPAGAYFSVSGIEETPARHFLQYLLAQKNGFKLNDENLQKYMLVKGSDDAPAMLKHMQNLGWVQGLEKPPEAPTDRLETILPDMLSQLSASGKALLADHQGFYISSCGFPHETAEELSGLSASLATLHDRYRGVLKNNLGESSSAWGLVDAMGNSQVGFWPMFIGEHRFGLVIGGLPQMNRPALISLVWALMIRYGNAVDQIED